MAIIVAASLLVIGVLVFILSVRAKDLPETPPPSPFEHLDERKASIYENLRDLQFEYRVGKMSDADYQSAKADLQKELARVLAEIDKVKQELGGTLVKKAPPPRKPVCPHCGARFEKAMKFCGECGKAMGAANERE